MHCFHFFPILVINILVTCFSAVSTRSLSPCTDITAEEFRRDQCLEAIRLAVEDRSTYWFGSDYPANCGNQSEFLSVCFNPYGNHEDSLVSRIFRRRFYDRNNLNTILHVTYQTYTGEYEACGHKYAINEARTVNIDPLNYNEDLTPFQLLQRPDVTWKDATSNVLHTLAIYDAGYVTVKALYVNVPGSDISMGQTVVPYEPPLNPTTNKNPYVFLLFLQPERLELSSKWLHRLSRRDEEQFEDFLSAFNLEGPVGISWFTVRSDPYSAEVKRSRGYMNTCAHFVNKEFQTKELPFLTRNSTELTVYVDMEFEVTALKIDSCCHRYSYPANAFRLNPIGDAQVQAAFVRTGSSQNVQLTKSTAFSDRARDFKNQIHALLVVDLSIPPAFGTPRRPFLHWLVVNIQDGDFSTGEEIFEYMGPAPPNPYDHTYYFLLFEQSQPIYPEKGDYSYKNCSSIFFGRCGFDIEAMIENGGLSLVGATWMLVKNDEYVRYFYVDNGMPEEQVCASVPGFRVNCDFSIKAGKDGSDNDNGGGGGGDSRYGVTEDNNLHGGGNMPTVVPVSCLALVELSILTFHIYISRRNIQLI